MRICITSSGPDLDSLVDPRFGRCPYFIFVDSDNLEKIDVVSNEGINAARGAGVRSAQTVIAQKAEAVITGNVGPNSFMVLSSSKIKVFQTLTKLKIKEALSSFNQDKLSEITRPVGTRFSASGQRRGLGRGRGLSKGK